MQKLTDRLITWLVRAFATVMLFAGVSMLLAGVPSYGIGMLSESPVARTIANIFLQIGGVFVAGGGAALYLSRQRGLLLPNERAAVSDADRPAIGDWLIALAIFLVALPVWMVLRLQPFLAEWRTVLGFLGTSRILEGANANGSGLVLLPLTAALTPPLFELGAMIAFVVSSVFLLVLLLSRSQRFPRLYLACVLIVSALVISSVRGAAAAAVAVEAGRQLVESTNPSDAESAQFNEGFSRYATAVSSTAPVLVWTLFGYLVWIPPLIFSQRARVTFASTASGPQSSTAGPADIEAITSPPRFRS
jgi:hypothetical protein